jgi:hypothetical protein
MKIPEVIMGKEYHGIKIDHTMLCLFRILESINDICGRGELEFFEIYNPVMGKVGNWYFRKYILHPGMWIIFREHVHNFFFLSEGNREAYQKEQDDFLVTDEKYLIPYSKKEKGGTQ